MDDIIKRADKLFVQRQRASEKVAVIDDDIHRLVVEYREKYSVYGITPDHLRRMVLMTKG